MARVYATRTDLLAYAARFGSRYTVPAEPEATGLLTMASERVEDLVTQAYDVDTATLLPTDTDVAAGLRDAVCALVLLHLDQVASGSYTTVSIGTVTLTGSASSDASGSVLAPCPYTPLRRAGLVGVGVTTAPAWRW